MHYGLITAFPFLSKADALATFAQLASDMEHRWCIYTVTALVTLALQLTRYAEMYSNALILKYKKPWLQYLKQ